MTKVCPILIGYLSISARKLSSWYTSAIGKCPSIIEQKTQCRLSVVPKATFPHVGFIVLLLNVPNDYDCIGIDAMPGRCFYIQVEPEAKLQSANLFCARIFFKCMQRKKKALKVYTF
jgi:hypothetical protein